MGSCRATKKEETEEVQMDIIKYQVDTKQVQDKIGLVAERYTKMYKID